MQAAPAKSNTVPWEMIEPWAAPLLIFFAVLAFYAIPMAATNASIQGDAVNIQFPLQKYFTDHLSTGHLPFWSPYIFSGYPVLANPEMQAWYPPNWLFYLFWMKGSTLQFEIALNALIACLGAYFFFRQTVCRSTGAILGAFAYGLSGFFAGHSQDLPTFAAAAWFPWILWSYRRTVDSRSLSALAVGGLAGGAAILAGSLPTALFGFIGLVWYVAADISWNRRSWGRAVGVAGGMTVLAVCVSCIQLLPALELVHLSRLATDYSQEILQPRYLLTLLLPDATGTIAGRDHGLVTNHYFYAGLLLLPLAANGARNRRTALGAFALILPAIWYMLGPAAGLYRLGAVIPAWQQLGPPDAAWFLPAFGLAWLAAGGCHHLSGRLPYAGILAAALMFGDLWYWNLSRNPLAYARQPLNQFYNEDAARSMAEAQTALTRFDSPKPLTGMGPLLFPLDVKFETTTGGLALEPAVYHEYLAAIAGNPRLRDGLNVLRYVDPSTGQIEFSPKILPRAYFPRSVVGLGSENESRAALAKLDPTVQSTVLAPDYILRQDPDSDVFISGFDEQSYGIHYRSHIPSLLKLCGAWYPGWRVRVNGRPLPIVRVDHALLGVVVPPGEGVVEFTFRSRYFAAGVLIVLVTLTGMAVVVWGRPLWLRLTMKPV